MFAHCSRELRCYFEDEKGSVQSFVTLEREGWHSEVKSFFVQIKFCFKNKYVEVWPKMKGNKMSKICTRLASPNVSEGEPDPSRFPTQAAEEG